jgi:trimeric autotransporter adhesin
MDGSIVVTGWAGNTAPWPYELVPTSDTRGIDPAFPLTKYPDAVFEDGVPLSNVCAPDGTPVTPTAGEFCINYAAQTLTLGDDPTGHEIRASNLPLALVLNSGSDGSAVEGLSWIRYAPHYDPDQHGAVLINSNNVSLDNISCFYSSNQCVEARNVTGLMVTNGDFENNREGGLAGSQLVNATFQNNIVSYNNVNQHFLIGWDTAGAKFAGGSNIRWDGNTSSYNGGSGVWFDFLWSGVAVVNNVVQFNASHGIDLEKGGPAIVANNLITDSNGPVSDTAGINEAGDQRVENWNNTVAGSFTDMAIVDSVASGVPVASGNQMFNTIMADGVAGDFDLYYVHAYSGGQPASQIVTASDFNVFYQNGRTPPSIVGWDKTKSGTPVQYATLARFVAANPPYDAHSVQSATLPFDASYQSIYQVGALLPADVATALGVPAGSQMGIGYFGSAAPISTPIATPTPTPGPPTPTPVPSTTPTTTPISTPTPDPTPTPEPSPTPTLIPTPGPTPIGNVFTLSANVNPAQGAPYNYDNVIWSDKAGDSLSLRSGGVDATLNGREHKRRLPSVIPIQSG